MVGRGEGAVVSGFASNGFPAIASGVTAPAGRPLGVTLLSIFFAAGTVPSTATALALAFPGAWSEVMWRLKPEAPGQFAQLGAAAIPLMLTVAAACAGASVGLWIRRAWGRRLAMGVLGVILSGDALNANFWGDWRTLIGLLVGGTMLAYLFSDRVRAWFSASRLRGTTRLCRRGVHQRVVIPPRATASEFFSPGPGRGVLGAWPIALWHCAEGDLGNIRAELLRLLRHQVAPSSRRVSARESATKTPAVAINSWLAGTEPRRSHDWLESRLKDRSHLNLPPSSEAIVPSHSQTLPPGAREGPPRTRATSRHLPHPTIAALALLSSSAPPRFCPATTPPRPEDDRGVVDPQDEKAGGADVHVAARPFEGGEVGEVEPVQPLRDLEEHRGEHAGQQRRAPRQPADRREAVGDVEERDSRTPRPAPRPRTGPATTRRRPSAAPARRPWPAAAPGRC